MLTGPQLRFAEGVVAGLSAVEAYRAAYPKAAEASVNSNAFRLMDNDGVKSEIARQRAAAELVPGSAVLTLAAKRNALAAIVSAANGTYAGSEVKTSDRIAAIKLDNDLAGDGKEAEANDALSSLLSRCMG